MRTRCPQCSHPVAKGVFQCPNCPASWEEEATDYRPIKRRDERAWEGPVVWFAILGGGVFLAWMGISRFIEIADPDRDGSPLDAFVQQRAGQLDARVAAAARGDGPDGRRPSETQSQPAPSYESSARRASEFSGSDEDGDWKVRGGVFDLTTLAPVAGAEVVFEAGERRKRTSTDGKGRYALRLEALDRGGYQVRISKRGYAPNYFIPGEQGVAYMSPAERRSLARDLAGGSEEPGTVQPYGAEPVTTDFYLAPSGAR